MKITLVNPPPNSEADKHWARYPLLGLGYVAASLRAAGHTVVMLDGKLAGLSVDQIRAGVEREAPDLVGITCMTVEFPAAKRISDAITADGCRAPIVLGGAHVNAVGRRVLDECPSAEFACVGEGEHLICELADALEGSGAIEEIPGLIHRMDGRVRVNPPRAYYDDYDALPFPAWDLFEVGEQIPIMTHRGCPFQCNFCGHNSGFKPRYRSAQNVLDELRYSIERFAPQRIRFEDETFGLNVLRTREILQGILDAGFHERTSFSAQTRVDRLDSDLVELLRACNFAWLELGVESGNEEIISRMGKGISLAEVERAVTLAREAGLRVWCKFILGHPNETVDQMRDTIDFVARMNPDRLSVSLMTPFPGTPIYDMAIRGEGGYRLLSRDWANFDKYTSGVLELETVKLSKLKWLQIWCYVNLYVKNRRFGDLARLAASNRTVVSEMCVQAVKSLVRPLRGSPDDTADLAPGEVLLPLSDVSMPDSTLVKLRLGAARREAGREGQAVGAEAEAAPALRSWASPGSSS